MHLTLFLLPRDKLGYALSLKWVKSIVLMMFTAYLVVAIWGITGLKEGLEKRNTVNFDSYSIPFFDADDKYYMVRAHLPMIKSEKAHHCCCVFTPFFFFLAFLPLWFSFLLFLISS